MSTSGLSFDFLLSGRKGVKPEMRKGRNHSLRTCQWGRVNLAVVLVVVAAVCLFVCCLLLASAKSVSNETVNWKLKTGGRFTHGYFNAWSSANTNSEMCTQEVKDSGKLSDLFVATQMRQGKQTISRTDCLSKNYIRFARLTGLHFWRPSLQMNLH